MTVTVYKANGADVPDLELSAREPVSFRDDLDPGWERRLHTFYRQQAVAIVDALVRSLPGGTVDHLFAELAARKASLLRVVGDLPQDQGHAQ